MIILAHWLFHPLAGRGYQFWSGIGSDISELTLAVAVVSFAIAFWRRHCCHHPGCHRLSWHVDHRDGHPKCRRHHPHDPDTLATSANE